MTSSATKQPDEDKSLTHLDQLILDASSCTLPSAASPPIPLLEQEAMRAREVLSSYRALIASEMKLARTLKEGSTASLLSRSIHESSNAFASLSASVSLWKKGSHLFLGGVIVGGGGTSLSSSSAAFSHSQHQSAGLGDKSLFSSASSAPSSILGARKALKLLQGLEAVLSSIVQGGSQGEWRHHHEVTVVITRSQSSS